MPIKFQNHEKSNPVTKSNIILFSCLQFHHGNANANLSAISDVVEKKEDENFKYNLIRDYHFFAHSSNPCPIDQVDFRSPGQDNAARAYASPHLNIRQALRVLRRRGRRHRWTGT